MSLTGTGEKKNKSVDAVEERFRNVLTVCLRWSQAQEAAVGCFCAFVCGC